MFLVDSFANREVVRFFSEQAVSHGQALDPSRGHLVIGSSLLDASLRFYLSVSLFSLAFWGIRVRTNQHDVFMQTYMYEYAIFLVFEV